MHISSSYLCTPIHTHSLLLSLHLQAPSYISSILYTFSDSLNSVFNIKLIPKWKKLEAKDGFPSFRLATKVSVFCFAFRFVSESQNLNLELKKTKQYLNKIASKERRNPSSPFVEGRPDKNYFSIPGTGSD